MKFKLVNQKDYMKKLALNLKAVSNTRIVESFKNFKITIKGDELQTLSFNGENCIVTLFKIENPDNCECSFLVESGAFRDIIDKFSKTEYINLNYDEDSKKLRFSFGRRRLNIKVFQDTTDFDSAPSLENFKDFKTVTVNKYVLQKAFKHISKFTSDDKTRPILEAINFIIDEDKMEIFASDGYRLGAHTADCQSSEAFNILINSSKSKSIIEEVLKNGYDFVEINSNGIYTMIENDDAIIFLKQISGEPLEYKKLLTREERYSIIVKTSDLKESLNVVMIERGVLNPVALILNPEESTMTIKNIDGKVVEDCEDIIDIKFMNELEDLSPFEIKFNGVYLLDVLSCITEDECVMHFDTNVKPVFVQNMENKRAIYLTLPVR